MKLKKTYIFFGLIVVLFLFATGMLYREFYLLQHQDTTPVIIVDHVGETVAQSLSDYTGKSIGELNELFFTEDAYANMVIVMSGKGELVKKIKVGGSPHDITASPDGKLVVTANHGSGNISLIDTATLRLVNTITTGSGAHGVAFSPDGNYLFVANEIEGTVSILDTNDFSRQKKVDIGAFPEYVAVTRDGSKVITTNLGGAGAVTILENNGLDTTVLESLKISVDAHGVAFSPDGTIGVLTNFSDSSTYLLDGVTLEISDTIETANYSEFATFYDDQELWMTHIGTHEITIINVDTNEIQDQIIVGETPHGITFSNDKSLAFIPLYTSGEVVIIDVQEKKVIKKVQVGRELHNSVMVKID